jgi:hypothetical protein
MRVSFEGLYTVEELTLAVEAVLRDLGENGAEYIRSVNLYLVPIADRRQLHFVDKAGFPTDHFVFDGPVARVMQATWLHGRGGSSGIATERGDQTLQTDQQTSDGQKGFRVGKGQDDVQFRQT